jgi:hypothetical protein
LHECWRPVRETPDQDHVDQEECPR